MNRIRLNAVRSVVLILAIAAALPAAAAEKIFPGAIARPNNKGDQVIFYYDVRDGFTTFLNLRNEAASALRVDIQYYGPDFGTPFTQTITLPATAGKSGAPGTGGLVVIDVGALRAGGLAATPGVAIATGVDDAGHAIVTRGLAGNFTVANVATGSAWGSPAAARSGIVPPAETSDACAPKEPAPKLGTAIDGTSVVFTPIQPSTADLTAYYDPATLAPAALGGNQLIFLSFIDVPGPVYGAAAAETTWSVAAVRNTGEPFPPTFVHATGVKVSDLAAEVGAVGGSSGAATFAADPRSAPLTRLVFFTESLGTFSTGYLLPRK